MKIILFACVHNAGRSQMAAALFNRLAARLGARRDGARPRLLTDDLARTADLLVTMGCGEACPHVPGLARDDWPLPDPKGQPMARVREIRDEIESRVARLLSDLFAERAG